MVVKKNFNGKKFPIYGITELEITILKCADKCPNKVWIARTLSDFVLPWVIPELMNLATIYYTAFIN